MLKKISDHIVNWRIAILVIMIALTVVSAVGALFVKINEDMTKYLPDDSNMNKGMDIMTEAFPEMAMANTIRVMFDDLTEGDKAVVLKKLSAIKHVISVDHDPTSSEYNKDNHTLFVINMSCDYDSAEEKEIEAALKSEFKGYTLVWQNDDTGTPDIPAIVIITAMICIFIILFTTCASWTEPILFLITIGSAVLINSGSNIFLGEIADVTNSITALLQMVLSIDYSIIMMNRYRQERAVEPDKKRAMKKAWVNAFSSVSSSSLTTVVGLLMLVFMSFKIGADLGFVLAKGVFISMVCVLTVLPALIVICDGLLIKTAKKELKVPMAWAAKFGNKARFAMTGVFVILFVGFYILQSFTGIAYILVKDDAVASVFPRTNALVMVYETEDEKNLGGLIETLEKDEYVTSVMGYGTILGKPYTSDKLAFAIAEMSDGFAFNSAMIDMLYYHYYNGGRVGEMTTEEFLSFISEKVVNDDTFSEYINEQMLENIDLIAMLADKSELQTQRSSAELASMLGVEEDMIKTVFTLHNADDTSEKTMSMSEFTAFLCSDLLGNPAFSDAIDEETEAQLKMLDSLIQLAASGEGLTPAEIASALGMDETAAKQLYYLYFSENEEFISEASAIKMSLPEFLAVVKEAQSMMPKAGDSAKLDAASFAALFGIQESDVIQLFGLYLSAQKTIPLADFTNFLVNDVMTNEEYSAGFTEEQKAGLSMMNSLASLAAEGAPVDAKTVSSALGMEESMINMVFRLYFGGDISNKKLSFEETVGFILGDEVMRGYMDGDMLEKLVLTNEIIKATVNETRFTPSEMSALFSGLSESLDTASVEMMYLYAESIKNADPTWTMTLESLFNHLVDKVINDARFSAFINSEMKEALLENKTALEDGKAQLVGEKYSRLVINNIYPDESEQTAAFISNFESYAANNMNGKIYLIGESAMAHEMRQIFDTELLFITMLTAFAIFLIVMFTFKSISIPLILVLLVQCGVYITVTVTGILSGEIYYLALLIVECILMGATIDYGILFTNYYCENRRTYDIKESLIKAYDGSMHTIMSSGLILVTVTAIVGGMFEDETVSSIVKTISIGSFCAILLILFVLPGILAACDKLVVKKQNK